MRGMIAQALAVTHPSQVSRLILAATQAGNGKSLPIPPAAMAAASSSDPATVVSVLFPPDQTAAILAYVAAIAQYPDFYGASAAIKAGQNAAVLQWMAGQDPDGHLIGSIRVVPTLVADGTQDALDPVPNDWLLARSIHRARLILYPDVGYAFLFQDAAAYVPAIGKFLSMRGDWN